MANSSLFADSRGPPWLPASATEARRIAYWGQLMCFVFMLVYFVLGVMSVIFASRTWGIYLIISAVVEFIVLSILKPTVFEHLDQGRFNEASDHLIILGILTLVFGVIPGIFLVTAFARLQEVFHPQYQPYAPGAYQEGRPPEAAAPYPPPPPAQAPPGPPAQPEPAAAQSKPKHPEMVKCRKCGVQYPGFMRTCPNCGEER